MRALWVLSRPRLLPYVLVLVAVGGAWAHWDRALTLRNSGALMGVMFAWALLHAGTLWLNAAVDRDDGEVLFGEAIEPPPGVASWGYVALIAAVVVATVAHPTSGLACAACAVMAVGYSHPRLLWKGHPIAGPAINIVGYGLLSPLAGWSVVEVTVNPRTLLVWMVGAAGVLGTYFAAQAFQGEEDAARGYRTLVVTHGPTVTIRTARYLIVGTAVVGMALAIVGWFPRICLLGLPLVWNIDRWMRRWSAEPNGGTEAWARGTAKRLLWMGAAGLLLATVEYVRASFAGEAVAGLGTHAGHPTDRPRLPPAQMRMWELANAVPEAYNERSGG
jgi:1,4-dihydroxy-2-naphthoate octaprenyltransferase